MSEDTQESRSVVVGAKVSPAEKKAIELVATVEGTSVSELLRPSIEQIVARGERFAVRLREMKPELEAAIP